MSGSRARWIAVIAVVVTMTLVVVVAVLSQLVGDDGADPSTAPGLDRAPLTGLPADDPAQLDHPAVAIKISDVRQAHPQAGVDRADIVFAQPIGAAYTRLAAVFHSELPESVGPVRSVRPADAALLGPLAPVFGNTMGAGWVMEYADGVADWDDLGTQRVSGSDAYVIDDARPRPDHVFARPAALLDLSARTEPPAPYFEYADDPGAGSAELAGGPGAAVDVPYGTGWTVSWTYDTETGRYLRDQPWGPHVTVDGTRISAVNVLIIEVDSVVGKLVEGHGAAVPILQLVDGSGSFTALAGGSSVTGTWTKAAVNDQFVFRTDDGDPLLLDPGNTWVELPAPAAPSPSTDL